eukprot:218395-Prymnesium_polylepis.1
MCGVARCVLGVAQRARALRKLSRLRPCLSRPLTHHSPERRTRTRAHRLSLAPSSVEAHAAHLRLASHIGLESHHVRPLLDERALRRAEAACEGEEGVKVGVEGLHHLRRPHLHRHLLPAQQHRAVHLPDGRRAERRRVDRPENPAEGAQLRFERAADVGERPRRIGLAEQRRERHLPLLAQHACSQQELCPLDEYAPAPNAQRVDGRRILIIELRELGAEMLVAPRATFTLHATVSERDRDHRGQDAHPPRPLEAQAADRPELHRRTLELLVVLAVLPARGDDDADPHPRLVGDGVERHHTVALRRESRTR